MLSFADKSHKWIAVHMMMWGIGKLLFLAIKILGIQTTQLQHVNTNIGVLLLVVTISGIIDGFIFGLIDVGLDNKFQRLSLYQRLGLKTFCNLGIGLASTASIVPTLLGRSFEEGIAILSANLYVANLILIAFYIFFITFILQIFKLVSQWIVVPNLSELISLHKRGKEENRIFIFLDLKSSTSIAEKLGPERYSFFIKDCFDDMTRAADKTSAEIYQYVGDEAIYTWLATEKHIKNAASHFFMFRHYLQTRSNYYLGEYGIVPQFKAAIHGGKVIKTQVGVTKRSIAFHGDVVNTCSRIQGLCNGLQRDLLVSEPIAYHLADKYNVNKEGSFALKGKILRWMCLVLTVRLLSQCSCTFIGATLSNNTQSLFPALFFPGSEKV